MGNLFRLLAVALTLAGVGQAQAYDDDDDYYYSYRAPRVYYYPQYQYYPNYQYYRPAPGHLPGVSERTHDRTGTLPGVTPRYSGYENRYAYDHYYARPSTCGRYHYSRHGYCADARWRPPFKRHYPIYRYVTIVDYD